VFGNILRIGSRWWPKPNTLLWHSAEGAFSQ
jgi:hypothetical protein